MKSKKMNFVVAFFAILLVTVFIPKDAKATELSPNLYLGIQEFRQNTTPENMAYGIKNPDRNGDLSNIVGAKIWKIVRYNSSSSTDTNYDDTTNYYCVKAGVGFANTGDKATYDVSYNFKTERDAILARNDANLTSIVNTTNGTYYKIMALADLLYIPGQSSDSDKAELLSHTQSPDVVYTVGLTDDDIDAVQQAAIWYFTNYDDAVYDTVYNQLGKDSWLTYKAGIMSEYTALADYDLVGKEGEQREAQAQALYNYLINTAIANASQYQNGTAVSKSTITLYANSTVSNQQPVIEITKEKEFDLALRKYITKVGSTVLSGANSRVPDIDESTITTNKTATYKHKKDPVLVNTGDVVTYNLTIYNEGDKAGRATQIIDQLPTGLQFSKINTAGFTATANDTTNRVTITRDITNTTNLPAYSTGDPASETIEIECIVTKTKGDNAVVLTNVAWISEEIDAESNITITDQDGADRDSEPSTIPTAQGSTDEVNKNNISAYKGTTTQTDLSQNIYYPGQQDDDDFEKLILPAREKEFDLALRKYITKVGNTVLSGANSRVPDIDESTIATNKTATYKHKKDPVLVKTGDVVTYNLTIYNEGEKAGRATQIIDQLPTGLEFSKINTPGFTAVANSSTNKLIITRDTTNTTNLPAYTTGDPASETIEIECIVTKKTAQDGVVLTNVAWISEEYDAVADKTITNQQGADRDSEPATTPTAQGSNDEVDKDNMSDYKGTTTQTDLSQNIYYPGQQDDDDFEKLVLVPGEFDLKLIKSIVEVNSTKVPERIESIDISKLNTLDTNGDKITTATYNLNKTPVAVKKGDIVKYRQRIYNEGEIDGYAAEISENIPEGLEFIWSANSQEQIKNDTTISQTEKEAILYNQLVWGTQQTDSNGKVTMVKSTYLAKGQGLDITETNGNLIKAFDGTKGYVDTTTNKNPDYKEIYVYMRVISDEIGGTVIRNEAAVTEDRDPDNNTVTDRDSQPENWPGKDPAHRYQDDEDYDNIILQDFDLALRKFIIAVSDDTNIEATEYLKDSKGTYTRAPQVDTSKLNTVGEDGKTITTAKYNHTKEPLVVDKNDVVVYMLRVYNEGQISGYATEITDYLPEGLDFVEGEFNKQYDWQYDETTHTVKTTYLKDELIEAAKTNAQGKIELDYAQVPIMCKLNDKVKTNIAQTNIAEISEDKDENKKDIDDRDSKEDNVNVPIEGNKPTYKDDETGKYIPGQQDDDDFEKVIVKPFDLALRKFITQVEKDTVNTRIPQVKYDKEKDQITYEHTKDPVDVVSGNTVVYTIRVFNEGARDGYAAVISDDMPAGLEFLPENKTNTEYRWKMYRKVKDGETYTSENALVQDGVTYVVTTKEEEAEIIATDYLSKEQGEARMEEDEELTENPALLKAFKADEEISDTNPDYKDVKVAFKVVEPNTSDKIIVNSAQIAKDTDKDGNEVDDDDSIPGKWNEGEDDQDKEYIKLNYFDLALRKWVTQAIVIENGKETITQTGHTPDQDPEPIVKVDLHRKKIDKVTVKFRYSIRITNQGDIAGYAKEIKDYVPQGLKFVAADNPVWTDLGDNVISTNLLADKLLKPGESADVEVVLTWINGNDNIGLKTNIAEISKDYNDKGVPDKDSTPDNKKDGEDDIDDAPVMLAVATGLTENAKIYIGLGFVVLITIAGGIVLIKKFVI